MSLRYSAFGDPEKKQLRHTDRMRAAVSIQKGRVEPYSALACSAVRRRTSGLRSVANLAKTLSRVLMLTHTACRITALLSPAISVRTAMGRFDAAVQRSTPGVAGPSPGASVPRPVCPDCWPVPIESSRQHPSRAYRRGLAAAACSPPERVARGRSDPPQVSWPEPL